MDDLLAMEPGSDRPDPWSSKPYTNPHRVLLDDRGPLGYRIRQVKEDPGVNEWLLRLMVRRDTRVVVGLINFHGRPDARGTAEIGYAVAQPCRRQGYAREAALGMWRWALSSHPEVQRLRAAIAPTNEASVRMIEAVGFSLVGEQIDEEDGLELIYEMGRYTFSARYGTTPPG